MPYATTAELPADVRGALPEAAQALWMRVANSALGAGEDDASAARIAWTGLRNAGWRAGPHGWAQAAKRRSNAVRFVAPVTKAEGTDDEVIVSGWASVALDADGNAIIDHDAEIIPVPVLKAAAADFLSRSREFNAVDHYSQPCGSLLESVVMDPATRVAMGLDGTGITGWWVSAKVRGPAAKRARSGELKEFSIEATALKRRNGDGTTTFLGLRVDRITLVDAGAGVGVRIEAVKARKEAPTMDMQAILAKLASGQALSPDELKAITDALAGAAPAVSPEMVDLQKQAAAANAEMAVQKRRADEAVAALKARDDEAALTPEQREEAALKRLPPEQREREVALKSRIASLEAAAKKRDEDDAQAAAKKRAEALKCIPGFSIDEMAFALRGVDSLVAKHDGGKTVAEIVNGLLKTQAETIAKSLQTHGSAHVPEDGSAEAQFEAVAKSIVDRDPELRAMPIAKALPRARIQAGRERPDLYAQIRKN